MVPQLKRFKPWKTTVWHDSRTPSIYSHLGPLVGYAANANGDERQQISHTHPHGTWQYMKENFVLQAVPALYNFSLDSCIVWFAELNGTEHLVDLVYDRTINKIINVSSPPILLSPQQWFTDNHWEVVDVEPMLRFGGPYNAGFAGDPRVDSCALIQNFAMRNTETNIRVAQTMFTQLFHVGGVRMRVNVSSNVEPFDNVIPYPANLLARYEEVFRSIVGPDMPLYEAEDA